MVSKRRKTTKFLYQSETIVSKAIENAKLLKDESQYESIRTDLKNRLFAIGMNVNVYFYGSRIIGLANNQSDLDIFIEFGKRFYLLTSRNFKIHF